jgi:hypothetical protein
LFFCWRGLKLRRVFNCTTAKDHGKENEFFHGEYWAIAFLVALGQNVPAEKEIELSFSTERFQCPVGTLRFEEK